MWGLLSRANKRAPRTPDGLRIYVIGDVHGRADLLAQLLACIDADIASHSAPRVVEVFLGDYIDRVVRNFVKQREQGERFATWAVRADEADLR